MNEHFIELFRKADDFQSNKFNRKYINKWYNDSIDYKTMISLLFSIKDDKEFYFKKIDLIIEKTLFFAKDRVRVTLLLQFDDNTEFSVYSSFMHDDIEYFGICSIFKTHYELFGNRLNTNKNIEFINSLLKKEIIIEKIIEKPVYSYNNRQVLNQKCYLMVDSNTGLTKIGKSANPIKRERTLQSEKPTIKLIHVFNEDHENELHNKFNNYRIRGEWFKLSEKQIQHTINSYN
jgi:hypothetical protein